MTTTVHSLASEAASCFEYASRDDDDRETYVRVKDGSPAWVTEMVREAHDGFLPDDWRYACISAAVDAIDEAGEDADLSDVAAEFADSQIDVYTADRLAWLSSSLRRSSYVDEAASEGLVSAETDTVDRIGIGQYMEAHEVFAAVQRFLETRAEEAEDVDYDLLTDAELAEAMRTAEADGDDDALTYATNEIAGRLDLPLSQTEQGLTVEAEAAIQHYVLVHGGELETDSEMSLRPRPGETAEQTVARVTAAAQRKGEQDA